MKLKIWDEIRVISPSESLSTKKEEKIKRAKEVLENMWFRVTFSKNCFEIDDLRTSSVESRLDDLHEAFRDPNVKMIIAAKWGFTAPELVSKIDYELVKSNPKLFMGYSDITNLHAAFYNKAWLKTFWWPNFSWFADNHDYVNDYFIKLFVEGEDLILEPAKEYFDRFYSDDEWNEIPQKNEGYVFHNYRDFEWELLWWTINTGAITWRTDMTFSFNDKVAFLEYYEGNKYELLMDLLDLDNAWVLNAKALLFGRTMWISNITIEDLKEVVSRVPSLKDIPVIFNVDFGHTAPQMIIPYGAILVVKDKKLTIKNNLH